MGSCWVPADLGRARCSAQTEQSSRLLACSKQGQIEPMPACRIPPPNCYLRMQETETVTDRCNALVLAGQQYNQSTSSSHLPWNRTKSHRDLVQYGEAEDLGGGFWAYSTSQVTSPCLVNLRLEVTKSHGHGEREKHRVTERERRVRAAATGISRWSLLTRNEQRWKSCSRWLMVNAAEEKGLIWSKFQQTLSEREPQEIRLPNESSASVLTTCQFLWISKASVYAST